MSELFQFTFNIPNREAELVQFFTYAETAQEACDVIRSTGALQQEFDEDDLIAKISHVYQVTNDGSEDDTSCN